VERVDFIWNWRRKKKLEIIRTTSFIWFWRRSGLTESGLADACCMLLMLFTFIRITAETVGGQLFEIFRHMKKFYQEKVVLFL